MWQVEKKCTTCLRDHNCNHKHEIRHSHHLRLFLTSCFSGKHVITTDRSQTTRTQSLKQSKKETETSKINIETTSKTNCRHTGTLLDSQLMREHGVINIWFMNNVYKKKKVFLIQKKEKRGGKSPASKMRQNQSICVVFSWVLWDFCNHLGFEQ